MPILLLSRNYLAQYSYLKERILVTKNNSQSRIHSLKEPSFFLMIGDRVCPLIITERFHIMAMLFHSPFLFQSVKHPSAEPLHGFDEFELR